MCVGDVQCPKGAMTEAQKGLRERNMFLYSVRNYLLGFRRISGVRKQKKRISTVWRKIGIRRGSRIQKGGFVQEFRLENRSYPDVHDFSLRMQVIIAND